MAVTFEPATGAGAGPGAIGDPSRAEGRGFVDTSRHIRAALLLGWRVESNWADPALFAIYTVIKPVSSMLLLTVMVSIVGGSADQTARTFVILGSALWAMLVAGLAGPAWSVLEDRERYRTLKYLYTSPATFLILLAGRGGARLLTGAMGTLVALVFAVILLGLRIDPFTLDWPLLIVTMLLGLPPVLALGIVLAAVCLQTRQESWNYPDAFSGAMFLVSGVVFPLAILPNWLQAVGLLNPITWWVAGVRRAVLPGGPSSIGGADSLWTAVTGTAAPEPAVIVIGLFLTGAVTTLVATLLFRGSERRARDRGLLDRTTGS
jgi:ABC-2 type transport system permease protein